MIDRHWPPFTQAIVELLRLMQDRRIYLSVTLRRQRNAQLQKKLKISNGDLDRRATTR
jgi:hypothetical protein